MANRVTIQDIADALGLSRNTVSKAINNTGILAEDTKERILQKAMEMGYKTFSYVAPQEAPQYAAQNLAVTLPFAPSSKRTIALFSGMFLDNSHFASTMLDKFQHEIAQMGYSMTLHRVSENNLLDLSLPFSFCAEDTAAIVCIEVFDYEYCKMICDLDIPVLLVDAPTNTYTSPLMADTLMMENFSGIYQIIQAASSRGITRIGYIGEKMHCRSFFERYMAFREALYIHSLPIVDEYCLTEIHEHGRSYREHLRRHIHSMSSLPELFICANDFVALDLLLIIREMGLDCPKDILITGFDNSPESKIVTPPLTTCHIHSQIMGFSAAQLLFSRFAQPDLNYRIIHTETNLIYRDSTRKEFEDA